MVDSGNIGPDRAEGTSHGSGNPSAGVFLGEFVEPESLPAVLTTSELAARLLTACNGGEMETAEFYVGKLGYRKIMKYCRAIERRTSYQSVIVENAQQLILLDQALQAALLRGIGTIEVQFRAVYSRFMADEHGPFAHRHGGNFQKDEHFEKFLEDYGRELGYKIRNGNRHVKASFDEYGDLPIWEAVDLMPLGTLSKLYKNTRSKDIRRAVADTFGCKYEFLTSWLRTICEVRNRCAHFDDVCITPLVCRPKRIPGVNAQNDTAFYAALVVQRLIEGSDAAIFDVVSEQHYTSFANEFISIADKMPQIVFRAAGFPPNWMNIMVQASSIMNGFKVSTSKLVSAVDYPA